MLQAMQGMMAITMLPAPSEAAQEALTQMEAQQAIASGREEQREKREEEGRTLEPEVRKRQYAAIAPEGGAAAPPATAAGIPANNNSGVIKNPPPTPNNPERNPTHAPMPRNRKMLTDSSAIGR